MQGISTDYTNNNVANNMAAGSVRTMGSSAAENTGYANFPLVKGGQESEGPVLNPGEDKKIKAGFKSSPAECETCQNRKYQDGSDENDVSFQTPGHIDPDAAASTVLSHEYEHVANAYEKARDGGGEVKNVSVSLKTDICPECGRSYISGGVTRTQISYPNENNPYQKDAKEKDADGTLRGFFVDIPA